jgi:hypothetical protein
MNGKIYSGPRWIVLLGYLGILGFLLACMTVTGGAPSAERGILQLDNELVKVKSQNGNWEPLAGTSTFELVGKLENTSPWTVSGRTLGTNESTQIAQGLQVGDLVRVRGASLEDDTWLAYSIDPAQEQTSQTITLIGKVTSVDPWVVNGTTLKTTADTVINGDIKPGMLARVEILLLEDGTWEVVSISPLGDIPSTSGCTTVTARIVSVNGNQVQFEGWPTPVTVKDNTQPDLATNDNNNDADENDDDENDNEGTDLTNLKPGQQVMAVVCTENGQVVITRITVLNDEDGNDSGEGAEKVLVCHKPDKKGGHTLSIAKPAVPAHLGHGDKLGPCP